MRRVLPFALLLPLGGCTGPLSYLDATSPVAGPIATLGWGLTSIAVAVCVSVAVLLLYAIMRRRGENADIAPVSDGTPIRWIGTGVAVSVVLLLGSAIWTLVVAGQVSALPPGDVLTVTVTGHQWWWEVEYDSAVPSRRFTTANELVIPAGMPVRIVLKSADVIHSFWVPKLGGKMDMIPSRTNITWLKADRPGYYRGQCTEFCGLQHANMAFFVRALEPSEFAQWWTAQLRPAPTGAAGAELFIARCGACHSVRGITAGGIVGPDLSHFGGRSTIAAGTLANTAENLKQWIDASQTIKPGSKMPELHLPAAETTAIATYLEGLD